MTVCADAPDGDVYCTVAATNGLLVLRPARPPRQTLRRGDRVECVSVVGLWHTSVEDVNDREMSVRLPAWASRAARRKHRRVPADVPVKLSAGGSRPVAGRLVDISLGGASVLMEPLEGLRPGAAVSVVLPSGDASAVVSTVRTHDHPGLRVVGIAWKSLGPESAPWVGRQVAAGASSVRRRQFRPGDRSGS